VVGSAAVGEPPREKRAYTKRMKPGPKPLKKNKREESPPPPRIVTIREGTQQVHPSARLTL
jgi:hypothetical protein